MVAAGGKTNRPIGSKQVVTSSVEPRRDWSAAERERESQSPTFHTNQIKSVRPAGSVWGKEEPTAGAKEDAGDVWSSVEWSREAVRSSVEWSKEAFGSLKE